MWRLPRPSANQVNKSGFKLNLARPALPSTR